MARASGCILQQCTHKLPDGYRYIYANGVFYGNTGAYQRGTDAKGHPVEYFFQPACDGNTVDASGQGTDRMCRAALAKCPPPEVDMWVFSRPLGDPNPPKRSGEQCMGSTRTVTLAAAQAAFINYLREKHLPKPTVGTAPGQRGLVNLPQIVWTQNSDPVSLRVTEPLPATISAEPHWSWDFGDGTSGPDEPGTPYQPGVYPKDHPGLYVDHAYAKTGPATVTVTVTWEGHFVVDGIARTFLIPPITLTATRALTMYQARSELVAGGR